VNTGFVADALVTFAWCPRDRRPSHVGIVVDGRSLSAADAARWTRRYDPSLAATWEELSLARVNYENCARMGHFGREMPWERPALETICGRPMPSRPSRNSGDLDSVTSNPLMQAPAAVPGRAVQWSP
jgi:hypothetical protein